MKRSHYFPWMGLIPLVLGGCYVYSTAIPVVGTLLFTLLPLAHGADLGLAGDGLRAAEAALLAQPPGRPLGVLLSVLCGAWQFWLVDDAARSIPIALFGQFISGVVPGAMMLVTPVHRGRNLHGQPAGGVGRHRLGGAADPSFSPCPTGWAAASPRPPDRPGKEVLRWKSTHGNASGGVWSAGTPGASLLKFLFLFLALCVVLDVWGPGQIALMALLGLFVLWLLARYLRVRNEGLDGDADQLIYFDLLGRMKAPAIFPNRELYQKRSCVVIRDRDGRRFAKVRKQLCSPRELEEQLREACPHLKWEGSP